MKEKENVMKNYWFIRPDPTLKSNLMAFGCEVDSGWNALLEELFDKLEKLIDEKYPEFKTDFEIVQVKEKFASLRVYVNYGNDEIFALIDEYEDKSATICEVCGKSGETLNSNEGKGYWVKTVCPDCAKKFRYGKRE